MERSFCRIARRRRENCTVVVMLSLFFWNYTWRPGKNYTVSWYKSCGLGFCLGILNLSDRRDNIIRLRQLLSDNSVLPCLLKITSHHTLAQLIRPWDSARCRTFADTTTLQFVERSVRKFRVWKICTMPKQNAKRRAFFFRGKALTIYVW